MYETLSSILIDDLHLHASAVHPDASCEDAGLDRLAMVELRMVLQERLNMDVNDDELMATKRVADIMRLLEEHANSATGQTLR
jgi:acyl carrier protein